jgi:molecular chaperone GrpE
MSKAKLDPQILDLENKWKRALADYDNLQKRITREKEEFVKLANLILIDKLLDVLENLERVEKHVKDQGLELAVGQLREVLQAEGLEEIEVLGKQFDAQTMECVEQVKGEENQVLAVLTKGYKINGRVIRPAKVKVGNGEREVKDE